MDMRRSQGHRNKYLCQPVLLIAVELHVPNGRRCWASDLVAVLPPYLQWPLLAPSLVLGTHPTSPRRILSRVENLDIPNDTY